MELIEALDGQNALVFYAFEFDRTRILEALKTRCKGLRVALLESEAEQRAWNRGEINVLLAQPASCAYGLNLQQGGRHMIWYGLPWNLELYQQGVARLYRQGQPQPVIIHRLLVKDSADEMVLQALQYKGSTQQGLIDGIKELAAKAQKEARD